MTDMSWWAAAPELVLGAAWMFVPGAAIAFAAGFRRLGAVLAAPAVSVGLLAGLAVVLGAVGIPWTKPVLAVSVAVVTAVVWAVRRLVVARRDRAALSAEVLEDEPETGRRAASWLVVAGVGVGGLLAAVPLARGFAPDVMLQSWDTVFHLTATRFAIETTNASPFHLQAASQQVPPSTVFYPGAWHGIAALTTFGSVIRGTNALVLVVSGLVWPAGLAALGRVVAPRRPLVAALAPIAGAGYFAFPAVLMGWGWPNGLAVALIPAALALTVRAIGHGEPTAVGQRVLAAGLAVVGLGGIGLAHPNGALSFGIVATPVVVVACVRSAWLRVRARRGAGRGWLGAVSLVVGAVAWCVAWAGAVVVAGRGISDTSQQGHSGFRHGVWMALTGATNDTRTGWALLALLAVGVVVVLWWRRGVWMLFSLAALVVLAAIAETDTSHKWIVQAWFMDPTRLRAPAVVFAAIVVAFGLAGVAALVARVVAALAARAPERRARVRSWLTPVVAGVVVVVLGAATGGLWAAEHKAYFWGIGTGAASPDSPYNLVSTPEMDMIKRLPGELRPGLKVLGTPLNGSTLPYVVGNVPVVFTNFSGTWPTEAFFLALHFKEIHTNPEVCAAIRKLNIGYYYADTTVFNPGHPFQKAYAGLPGDPPQPGFELVDQGAGARVYRITACD